MLTIPEVEAFKAAIVAYKEANAIYADAQLDQKIAERDGDEENIAVARKAAQNCCTNVWYPAYKGHEAAAKALCEALGFKPEDIKSAL